MSRARQIADFGDGIATADIDDGAVTAAKINSAVELGKVLQVVTSSTAGFVVISSTSYSNTNLSATITPSSTSSIIHIIVSQALVVSRNSNAGISSAFRILDGDNNVIVTADRFTGISTGTNTDGVSRTNDTGIITVAHAPNTTSAITYRTQLAASTTSDSGIVVAQDGSSRSSIILMEIAG